MAAGKHKTIKSILKVAISNVITLLSGVFVGFILPKIIGVTDYGYYKTFSLYISYVGMFHFGIEDGIYLMFGGKDLNELDERKFRFYTLFLIILEAAIGIIIAGVSCIWLSGDIRFIFIFVAIYLFTINIGNYYQFISQITQRFTELTVVGIIRSCLTILSVVVMWLLTRYASFAVDYKIYIVCVVAISCMILAAYMVVYRKLTFGRHIPWKEGLKDVKYFIIIGLPLMVANLCSSLILTIDRQFVNVFFDTDTYAVYAFAYNMLSLITTATSAVSVVLFPIMKRISVDTLSKKYSGMVSLIVVFVSGCLLVYFPLCPFIYWFLPQYSEALKIFRVILPGLIGTSAITIIMHNYYKALGKNLRFFIISLLILALSAAADIAVYFIFKTTVSISVISVAVIIIWYVVAEMFFVRKFHIPWLKNFCFMLCCMAAFYGATAVPNLILGCFAYLISFLILLAVFYFKEIGSLQRRYAAKLTKPSAEKQQEDMSALESDGGKSDTIEK